MAAGEQLRVFTFWEPRGAVTPWLQLCRDTWRRGVGTEVVTLDYANLGDYLPPGTLDLVSLRKLPLMQQKDGIMIAILHRHGGLFVDMDTLILDDITPLLRTLDRTTLFNFGGNISFVGGRAQAKILDLWLAGTKARLALVANGKVDPRKVRWDFIGNESLGEVYDQLREGSLHRRLVKSSAIGRRLWALAVAAKPAPGTRGSLLRRLPRRIEWELTRRSIARHMIQFSTAGFFAELGVPRDGSMDRQAQYISFWLESDLPVETVARPGVRVVGLHNSWTPAWYAALSREEVLAHGSLLSRTLRHLLST